MNKLTIISILLLAFSSCESDKNQSDASGTFEATEIIISAEANGIIKQLRINEGESLKKGQEIGYIDSLQLHLKRKQLLAQIKAILSKNPDIPTQLAAQEEQLKQLVKEKERISRLLDAEAATQKQLDDINTQIAVLQKQLAATRSSLGITSSGLTQESMPLAVQIEQLNDQIARCRIVNPVDGNVLVKYAEENEMSASGKPLYKIADLSYLILRAFITGDQLSGAKLGKKVKVYVDGSNDTHREIEGTIEWISDKAEFTPKTIQTKAERANLVYAVKVRVKNDGSLKIGMYGEIKF